MHVRATTLISAPIERVFDLALGQVRSDGARVTDCERPRSISSVQSYRRGALDRGFRLVRTGAGTLLTAEFAWRPARRSALDAVVWGVVSRRALRTAAVTLVEQVKVAAERSPVVVVGAALLDGAGRLLAAQRAEPPDVAGWWEFPGGKVEPGEDERSALVRECREELGVEVELDGRLGGDVRLSDDAVLRVWTARIRSGEPIAREHTALRWLSASELDEVPWLPADLPLAELLRARLDSGGFGAAAG